MLDRIDVPLGLEGFDVTGSEIVGDVLEVSVRSSRRAACHHCGSVSVTGHGRNERRIRDRSCAYPCVLRWSQRRFRCDDCGETFRERHPAIAGRRAVTERFRRRLFERSCHEPFTDVASSEAVSCYRVLEAFEHHSVEVEAGPVEPPRVIAIDESAFKKKFFFHTVFSDPERRYVFDLVEGRHKGAAFGGLMKLDPQVRAGIETVVIDLHWPFAKRSKSSCLTPASWPTSSTSCARSTAPRPRSACASGVAIANESVAMAVSLVSTIRRAIRPSIEPAGCS